MEENQKMYTYDVVFSFAGAQRAYVEEVNEHLKKYDISVFYDNDNNVDLWGKNLYRYLDKLYSKQAHYCVMFISKEYAERKWTIHESQSAQERAFNSYDNLTFQEYILPVRFDDTEIPGIRSTTGYIDANHESPQQLAEKIAQKIGKHPQATNTKLSISAIYQCMLSILQVHIKKANNLSYKQTDNTIQMIRSNLEVLITLQQFEDYIFLFLGERTLEENPAFIVTIISSSLIKIINFSYYFQVPPETDVNLKEFRQVFNEGIERLLEEKNDII